MKEIITKFKCDNCLKEETKNEFPYKEEWYYIYNFQIKIPLNGASCSLRDKHFCSYKCMIDLINKHILEVKVRMKDTHPIVKVPMTEEDMKILEAIDDAENQEVSVSLR